MDPRASTEHKQPVSFCGETRRGTLSSFGAAELGHCEPRAACASGGSLPAPKRNERAEAAGGQRDPDKMVRVAESSPLNSQHHHFIGRLNERIHGKYHVVCGTQALH